MERTKIVKTKLGKVEGYFDKEISKYKGIPYALPPIGELRFFPPVSCEPWNNVLDATRFGPISPQPSTKIGALFGALREQSEADCLTLNIWAPVSEQEKRPVMVWIHGGGFFMGNGADLDGAHLSLRGNVVIVSINYRLGPLGFLYIPGVTANVGLLDQIAALKWVKDNIEAFGGDSENVTIFGESAGGTSVLTLMAMPAAKGLFHHVIAQSAVCHPLSYRTLATKEFYELLMVKLGLKAGDIDGLRRVPVKKLIEADPTHEAVESGSFLLSDNPILGPVIDKNTLPEHPISAIHKGMAREIELLIGTNQNEAKFWHALNPILSKINNNIMHERIYSHMNLLGQDRNKAEQIIKTYKEAREGNYSTTPLDIMDAFITDYIFRIPSIYLAEAQCRYQPHTFMYLFSWKSPMFDGKLGAAHLLELPFVFGLLSDSEIGVFPSKNEETQAINHNMMDSWTSFARTGNPNHKGIPEWAPYEPKKRATMLIAKDFKVVCAPFDKERAAWDQIF